MRLDICAAYIRRLPVSQQRRDELLARVRTISDASLADMMAEVHRLLGPPTVAGDSPAAGSIEARLGDDAQSGNARARGQRGRARLATTPPINRVSMAPRGWPTGQRGRLRRLFAGERENQEPSERVVPDSPDPRGRWIWIARMRRTLLIALVLTQTYIAIDAMTRVLPYHGTQPLEIAMLCFFTVLFSWISAGFWTAIAGFIQLMTGVGRYAISSTPADHLPIDAQARTAVIMPICNEDVARVFAGLRATYESLERTGALGHFDFYVLSDSNDADTRVAEHAAWLATCRELRAFDRFFYRWRRHRIKRKAGNVADFCRRWGANYRYMVVLDADSVMSGECLTRLVRLMEASPNAGIIQTTPRAAGRETLFARIQQFATRMYGPVFAAGMHFWELGESHYWGHNAIIRVAPFVRHCALARLPGAGPLPREILSHDFVEAALMRRAGWAVWIAYDVQGSYEEMPPNLIDELKRDRRWCLGNLINSRLFLMQGLHPAHRVVFMTGIMAYLSAPLWFASMLFSTALLALHTLSPPRYFVHPYQLFPLWPEWRPEWAIGLVGVTATLLLLPKVLSAILAGVKSAQSFGGGTRLAMGLLIEMLVSSLLAPIRMLFHTQFVIGALIGRTSSWKSPLRQDADTSWGEALHHHGWHTLLGVVWAAAVYWLNPSFLFWLLPVVSALTLSIPLSVLTSRVRLGLKARDLRLFLIPEETSPPEEIRRVRECLKQSRTLPGFVDAVVDPVANAVACTSGVARYAPRGLAAEARQSLIYRALAAGPGVLNAAQKLALLSDSFALSQLHFEVWSSPQAAREWRQWTRPRQGAASPAGEPAPLKVAAT